MNMMEDHWVDVGAAADVPMRGSRTVTTETGDIAIFKAADGVIFALWDKCPHKGGPLSQGIVHGHSVTCPLHNWVIGLETGEVQGPDKGCARKVTVRLQEGRIMLPANAISRRHAA
jgi:nitrite reductase (NADH) small subunit